MKKTKLTLGPCLFNWKVDDWKNFYFDIANNTKIDEVYLGETVCLRRDPFFKDAINEVASYLQNKGITVHYSTIQLVLGQPELKRAEELINNNINSLIEVSDISVLALLKNRNFIVAPSFNNYNEETLKTLEEKGAVKFCLPFEINKDTIAKLVSSTSKETEVMVFGKVPLAISARCYHARMHNKPKIDCEYVCNLDYNGKAVNTLSNENFLTVNGTQTMSFSYNNLIMELEELQSIGVNSFRLSPHYLNMVEVINTFYDVLNKNISKEEGFSKLLRLLPKQDKFSNGFYYGLAGKDLLNSTYLESNSE